MRRGHFAFLCLAGLLLWAIPPANAGVITWKALTHPSIAGHGPGVDKLIGTSDDTLIGDVERNRCNFDTGADCETTGAPTEGAYSYGATEVDGDVTHSCAGGYNGGGPCVCAAPAGQPCLEDTDCEASSCAGAGDCCPGSPLDLLSLCLECPKDDPPGEPFGYPMDVYTYSGSSPAANGTVTTCQEADFDGDTDPPFDFQFKAVNLAVTEASAGYGGGCLNLKGGGGPYLGSPCTGNGPITGTIEIETFHTGCSIRGGTIDNLDFDGDVINIVDPNNPDPATSTCGYTNAELKTIAAHAHVADVNAKYLMILCGGVTHSPTSDKACMRNAQSYLVWVLYTTDDAAACPDDGCP
jgi:hypothetical protein